MNYDPKFTEEMDENEVCSEIGDFVDDQLHTNDPAAESNPAQAGRKTFKDFTRSISMPTLPKISDLPKIADLSKLTNIPQLSKFTNNTKRDDSDHGDDVAKARPKRKSEDTLFGLPQLLATGIWLVLVVVIGVTLGRVMWVCAADVLAFGRPNEEVTITVTPEDDLNDVINKLTEAELIRYEPLFRFYANLSGAEEDIVPGTFTLNKSYDYHALVNEMSSSASNREEVTVQIPEGYSCRQIFQLLEDKGVATVAELEEYAANGELPVEDYWFLEGVERGDKYCLEGFLFPNTYNFYSHGGAKHALRKLLGGFKSQFNDDLKAQIMTLNTYLAEKMRANGKDDAYVVSNMFDVRDVIIVASLIEKEAANASEAPNIASVIYNRLFSWGSNPRYLNIDAALVYALDGKTELTSADTQIDHPYNTYKNTGLTPGPIANPGMSSIKAALDPAVTNYFYYVLDEATGEHVFTKTYDEHVAAGG